MEGDCAKAPESFVTRLRRYEVRLGEVLGTAYRIQSVLGVSQPASDAEKRNDSQDVDSTVKRIAGKIGDLTDALNNVDDFLQGDQPKPGDVKPCTIDEAASQIASLTGRRSR